MARISPVGLIRMNVTGESAATVTESPVVVTVPGRAGTVTPVKFEQTRQTGLFARATSEITKKIFMSSPALAEGPPGSDHHDHDTPAQQQLLCITPPAR